MAALPHPAATQHLPAFVTPPGETEVLMVVMALILALSVFSFGLLFLRLHTLPERIAHRTHKLQFEIVAVLGLIALFTHMHIFWIAGLLLALVDIPDVTAPLRRMAASLEKLAGYRAGQGDVPLDEPAASEHDAPAPTSVLTVHEERAKSGPELFRAASGA